MKMSKEADKMRTPEAVGILLAPVTFSVVIVVLTIARSTVFTNEVLDVPTLLRILWFIYPCVIPI